MILDILVLVVLLISAAVAFLRGFIREFLTILGVVGGLAAAYFGGPLLLPAMQGWLGVEDGVASEKLFGILPYDILADALAYGSVFIVVVIVLSFVSHLLAETARSMGMGAIDRTLGVVFGLVRGLLLLGLLYLPFHLFAGQNLVEKIAANSKTHLYIEQTAEVLAGFLPHGIKEEDSETLEEGAKGARKKLEEIDLLRKDGLESRNAGEEPASSEKGYSDEQRSSMDELFEEKLNETKELNLNE